MWFFAYKSLPNLLFGVLCLPGDQSHPVCATDNKPSCALHLLGWFIGSRGFSCLERRPEFWVLQCLVVKNSSAKAGDTEMCVQSLSQKDLLEEKMTVHSSIFDWRIPRTEEPGGLQSAAATAAKLLQSCPTLCDPIEGSPPGSPIPGILQARTLEWVAISFSRATVYGVAKVGDNSTAQHKMV